MDGYDIFAESPIEIYNKMAYGTPGDRRLLRRVNEVISRWDPLDLDCCVPDIIDEYCIEAGESTYISALIDETSGVDDIAEAIIYVFKATFGSDCYTPEECAAHAVNIKNKLEAWRSGVTETD